MTPSQAKALLPDDRVYSQQGDEKPIHWTVVDWPKMSGTSDEFSVKVETGIEPKRKGQFSTINLGNVKYFHVED